MSRENVEVVRAAYDAFNRGDWDAAFRDSNIRSQGDRPLGSIYFRHPAGRRPGSAVSASKEVPTLLTDLTSGREL